MNLDGGTRKKVPTYLKPNNGSPDIRQGKYKKFFCVMDSPSNDKNLKNDLHTIPSLF